VPADTSAYTAVADSLVQRAAADVDRVTALVASGVMARAQLEQAQERQADAQDQALLARILYANTRIEDMSDEDASSMIEAAKRRVDRQAGVVAQRQDLLVKGILAKSDLTAAQEELESRKGVYELAIQRVQLLNNLRHMAAAEEQYQRDAQAALARSVMIRFDGSGAFDPADLNKIRARYEKHFGATLPISALGQTLVHQAMGLDHRNRVDVALNPDSAEGVWLRSLLQHLNIPYLAFRAAVPGAATAPHIHIGTGSSRLKIAALPRDHA